MANPHELEKDADWFKRLAVWEESRKQYRSAVFYYTEAAQALLNSLEAGSKTEGLLELAQNYNNKVKELKSKTVVEDTSIPNSHISKSKVWLHLAEELKAYVQRTQPPCSDSRSSCSTLTSGASKKSHGFHKPNMSSSLKGDPGGFTVEELEVLRSTSVINGREYLPFLDALDLQERFSFANPFVDKDGLLALSNKQKSLLSRWVRPSDYINGPKMILAISCFSICQTVVTDCSFVASMAIAAQYERRFKKKLITK
ncbi:unnamed protein product [Schistosoma curassoni]|uniref:Calpain catalytic domain-containing protein n=1 Tax=Schistosoma curassoni TaxID=6186 RepID=A0A183KBC7_9TREM|nr:unnamed protein product [Schistosoma curassoni]